VVKERETRYREGIQQLLALAGEHAVCLFSGQENPLLSHRHLLIAQTLLRHDVAVTHILPDGNLVPAQADLFHSCI